MSRVRMFSAVVLGLCVAGSSLLLAQGKAPAAKKDRGPLPANYGKLGLSDEQRDKLYPVHEEYQKKIDDLTAQIKALQAERNAKFAEVLTQAQKDRLKELVAEEAAKRKEETAKRDAAKKKEESKDAAAAPASK